MNDSLEHPFAQYENDFPQLSADAVLLAERLGKPHRAFDMSIAGGTVSARIMAPVSPAYEPQVLVQGYIENRECQLLMPWRLAAPILDDVSAGLSFATLEPLALGAALEVGLAATIATLEQHLGARIRLLEAERLEMSDDPLYFEGEIALSLSLANAEPLIVLGRFAPLDLARLLDLSDRFLEFNPKDVSGAVDVIFRVGATELSYLEIKSLMPGDVMVIDDSPIIEGSLVAVAGETFTGFGKIAGRDIKLSGPFALARGTHMEKYLMETDSTDTFEDATLEEMPVRLIFECGRLKTSYENLKNVAEGYVFTLPRPVAAPIDIVANGKRIGVGELVRVGQAIGVRIVRINRVEEAVSEEG